MFFDDKKLKKVDLGNKKVESKEEFLKKLRDEKQNELKKTKQQENNLKIKKFFDHIKKKISSSDNLQKTLKNLKSINTLLEIKGDLDSALKDKVLESTFEKTKEDLNKIYKWNVKNTEEITKIVLLLLQKFSNDKLLAFFITNRILIKNIFINSLIQLYSLIKKDYLVDEKLNFFVINKIFESLQNFEIYSFIFKSSSKKESVFYFLNYILKSSKKLINEITRKEIMRTIVELNKYIIFSENKIYQTFYENSLKFILEFKDIYNVNSNILFIILSKCTNNIMMKYLQETDFIFLIKNISDELLITNIRNIFLSYSAKNNNINILNLFETFFYSFRKIDYKSIKDKSNILKYVNILLEFIFEFYSKIDININTNISEKNRTEVVSNNLIDIDNLSSINFPLSQNINININDNSIFSQENYKNLINVDLTEKLVLIIYQSSKLIKKLYEQSFDNSNLISLLDFIINKQAIKTNENIIDTILLYSLKYLDYKNEKINIHNFKMKDLNKILQILSFCVYSKIEYRENIFFIEFKNSWNIYQNIPFNYVYLNNLTKLLIHAFSYLINKKDIENIEKLTDNVIIHCLKSLYNLDSEIQFSQRKDNFWSNMELISKIQKFSQKKLIHSMKIMPFIFPFVFRLTFLNNHLKTLKKSVQNQNIHNQYHNDSDDDNLNNYNINISFSVKRNKIFEETFDLYLDNKLRPFAKWTITFINEFGIKEEGGKIIQNFFLFNF